MHCNQIKPQLDDYLDGLLAADAVAGIDRHVASCGSCDRLLQTTRSLQAALAQLPVERPGSGFFDRALAAATQQTQSTRPRARRWTVGAVAASLAVFALAALFVRDISVEQQAAPVGVAQVAMAVEETRTINLVFASADALEDVTLTVDLPAGIELASYPGQDEVRWTTRLQMGKNVLPLELIALSGSGGELIATLRRNDKEKVFKVNIAVVMG